MAPWWHHQKVGTFKIVADYGARWTPPPRRSIPAGALVSPRWCSGTAPLVLWYRPAGALVSPRSPEVCSSGRTPSRSLQAPG
eukprot:gene10529-biopygen7771